VTRLRGADAPVNLKPAQRSDAASTGSAPLPKAAAVANPEVSPSPELKGDHSGIPAKSNSHAAPIEVATVVPAKNRFNPLVFWVTGLAFLGGISAVAWVWRRRSRAPEEVSLITESIDRRKD
jgi:hypothetical protein